MEIEFVHVGYKSGLSVVNYDFSVQQQRPDTSNLKSDFGAFN